MGVVSARLILKFSHVLVVVIQEFLKFEVSFFLKKLIFFIKLVISYSFSVC